jgi:NAD(P)-dependent dehydrogenase (short-subunit alcohol dehydrogenase family)
MTQAGTASNLRRLEGRSILVTGAASGIGEATSRLFVEGARVALLDMARSVGQSHVVADLASEDSVKAIADSASTLGALDGVVMQRGYCPSRPLKRPNLPPRIMRWT